MKKIYVAGKLNADAVGYIHNMHKMIKTAGELKAAGYAVFVPALDILMGLQLGWVDYEQYFGNSQPWLSVSDAVFLVPGWETSPGTAKEITLAKSLDIPVFDNVVEMDIYFIGK
jgi:hypothetical protein